MCAVLLLTASMALAQTAGELVPLSNTRYGSAGGSAILRTNGTEPFVFWLTTRDIRATRVVSDQNRAGEVIFHQSSTFDAAWTGTHFLAVTTSSDQAQLRVIGRLVDAEAHPIGEPFEVLAGAQIPRIAAGHGSVLMVYESAGHDTRVVRLTPEGRVDGTPATIAPVYTRYAVAATANGFTVITSDAQGITATTLDTQARVVSQNTLARPGNYVDVSVVSRGTRALVVWTDVDRIEAAIVDGGIIGTPLLVDNVSPNPLNPLEPKSASAVWNGNGWTVAYQAGGQSPPRLRVAYLDANAQSVVSREEGATGARNPSLAVVDGAVLATWTPTTLNHLEPVWLGALPLGPSESYPVTFAAGEQHLAATASTPGGMLAAWAETIDRRVSLRAGVRTHTGQWTEHVVAASVPSVSQVVAETDGRNYVLFATYDSMRTTEAIFLDDNGRPTGLRVPLPLPVQAAAWSGTRYALIDASGSLRLLSPTGTLSAPMDLGVEWEGWDLASHGNGFVAMGGRVECQFLLCFPRDVRALRLDANGQRVGVELELAPDGFPLGVVWSGTEYIAVWTNATGVGFSRIPHNVDGQVGTRHVPMEINAVSLAPTSGGVAILDVRVNVREVKYFTPGGTQFRSVAVADTSSPSGRIDLVPLFDDRLAYVASPVRRDAPHYDVPRVSMAIVSGPPIAEPAAPHLTVREHDDRFLVEWTRPTGVVNGYRLEYRVDNGTWIEYERWFAPTETNIALRKPGFGSTFAFRVRAFNDTGAGAYSNLGVPLGRKRRAAR
ncbi:MAG TPA: fibronectin type III domain-containing protein [Thermoanaerobaculia bacterium]|nr:fibronectin type III domain-containing protein [Thermoanaerobaculia bacterium]